MKFIKVCYCLFFLLVFGGEKSEGQSWLWGKQGIANYVGEGFAGAMDQSHNVYLAGQLSGLYHNVSSLIFDWDTLTFVNNRNHGQAVMFIAKYDQNGNFLFANQSSKGFVDWGYLSSCVATDFRGNLLVTGSYYDSISFGAFTLKPKDTAVDVPFLVKYDSGGNVLWAKQALIPSWLSAGIGATVTTDNLNNVYIAGTFGDTLVFDKDTLISPLNGGVFIVKYDSNGNLVWANSMHGSIYDGTRIYDIIFERAGYVYLTGSFTDTIEFNTDTLRSTGLNTAFIVKFDINGSVIWARQSNSLSNNGSCIPSSLTFDKAENIYCTGLFSGGISFDGDTLNAPVQSLFLSKFDKNGNIIWAKAATPIYSVWSEGYGLSSDTLNHIYLSSGGGYFKFDGTTFMNPSSDPAQVMKLDTSGNLICSSSLNTGGDDLNAIISDPSGNYVYLLGDIESEEIFGPDTLLITYRGTHEDPFAARWQSCCSHFDTGSTSICKNNSCVLTAASGTSYIWSNGNTYASITVAPIATTNYYVIIDNVSCITDSNIHVVVNPALNPNLIWKNQICAGTPDTIIASGGSIYKWSNGDTIPEIIITPTSNTIYTVNISNGFCSVNDSVNIQVIPYPVPVITAAQYICSGQSATISASGGSTYLWNNGDTTTSISVTPTSGIKYYVTISNGICSVNDSTTITVNPLPIPYVCCDTTIYRGQKIQLNSSGGATYQWSPSTRLSCNNCYDPFADPTQTTTYTVNVTSDSGCTAIDSLTIIVLCRPASVCCDSLIIHGGDVQLISSGGNSYSWSPSAGLSCDTCSNPVASPSQTTTYSVTISDSGCVSVETVTIDVSCGDVFVANAFSPNEANNKILYVRGPCISTMDFMVFDRWGNKVFESQNTDNGWDGTYKGLALTTGTFVWYVKATLLDGTTVEKKGNVALVR